MPQSTINRGIKQTQKVLGKTKTKLKFIAQRNGQYFTFQVLSEMEIMFSLSSRLIFKWRSLVAIKY